MQIIDIKVSDLKPYEKNPRRNDPAVEPVMNSIKEFGFKVPIVVDKNNVIVCGHTRWKAAKKLGMKSVPCIMADDLTDEQIKAFRLADNKVGELAGWDFAILDGEMLDINIDMKQFGFLLDEDIGDIDDLFAESEPKEEKPEEPRKVQCPCCGEWFELED